MCYIGTYYAYTLFQFIMVITPNSIVNDVWVVFAFKKKKIAIKYKHTYNSIWFWRNRWNLDEKKRRFDQKNFVSDRDGEPVREYQMCEPVYELCLCDREKQN